MRLSRARSSILRCIYAYAPRTRSSRFYRTVCIICVGSVTNVRVGSMTDRNIVKPRRKRLEDPSGSRSSERPERPKEPARPPRTRTQQVACVTTTTNNSDFGNVTQRGTSAETQERPS